MEMTDLGQIAARKTDRCSNNATSCRLHKRDLFELERLDLLESSTLEAIQEGSHDAKILMAVDLIRIVVGVQLQVLKRCACKLGHVLLRVFQDPISRQVRARINSLACLLLLLQADCFEESLNATIIVDAGSGQSGDRSVGQVCTDFADECLWQPKFIII